MTAVIADTDILSTFGKVDRLDLLRQLFQTLCVTACNRNEPGLQSARFGDHILCVYRHGQDYINCP